jgi:hypothetical protein
LRSQDFGMYGRTDRRTSATLYAPTLWGHKNKSLFHFTEYHLEKL